MNLFLLYCIVCYIVTFYITVSEFYQDSDDSPAVATLIFALSPVIIALLVLVIPIAYLWEKLEDFDRKRRDKKYAR